MKSMTIRNIPDDVLAGFKAVCAYEKTTMQNKILQFVTEEAEKILLLGVHSGASKSDYAKAKVQERKATAKKGK